MLWHKKCQIFCVTDGKGCAPGDDSTEIKDNLNAEHTFSYDFQDLGEPIGLAHFAQNILYF